VTTWNGVGHFHSVRVRNTPRILALERELFTSMWGCNSPLQDIGLASGLEWGLLWLWKGVMYFVQKHLKLCCGVLNWSHMLEKERKWNRLTNSTTCPQTCILKYERGLLESSRNVPNKKGTCEARDKGLNWLELATAS
jgi:hypothetical protein